MVHPNSGFYEQDDKEYVSVSTVLGRTVELFHPDRVKGLEIWRSREPDWQEIMQSSQRRGTILHGEIESFFGIDIFSDEKKRLESPTMDEIITHNIHEYIAYLLPLLEDIKKQNGLELDGHHPIHLWSTSEPRNNYFLMEQELFCHLGCAGTADLRLLFAAPDKKRKTTLLPQYSIWDWKSARSYKDLDEYGSERKKVKSKSQYKEAFVQLGAYALMHNLAVKRGELDNEITQGVICVCYDWREPQLHVLSKQELKAAAQEFIERLRAYCSIENTQFPRLIQPCSL
jgi:hypothetical protein